MIPPRLHVLSKRFRVVVTASSAQSPATVRARQKLLLSLKPLPASVYEWPSVSERRALIRINRRGPRSRLFQESRYLKVAVVVLILIAAVAIAYYGVHRWKSRTSGPNFGTLRFTKLTNSGKAEDVAISPDGSYVIYSQRDHGGVGLWLHHIATGSETQILPSEDVDFRGLTFSPDGNSVYFVRTRKEIGSFKDLYAMPVLGGHARLLTRDIDSPVSFSPDGRQFVYTEGLVPLMATGSESQTEMEVRIVF